MPLCPPSPARTVRTQRRYALATAVALVAGAPPLFAQTAPPSAGAPTPAPAPTAPTPPAPTLGDVEVRARRPLAPAGRTELSPEDLRRLPGGGNDPMRAVQALPSVRSTDDSSAQPAVRGARPENNAYLIDFLPSGYLFHAGGLVSVLNPELIRGFELNAAAYGAEYPDVIGAVFDVRLRDPRRDRFGGVVDLSLFGVDALVEGPIGPDLSFWFAGKRSFFDLLTKESTDDKEGVTVTVPVYSDYQGRLLWTPNGTHRVSLNLNGAADRVSLRVRPDGRVGQQEPVLVGTSDASTSYHTAALLLDSQFTETMGNRLAVGRIVDRSELRIGSAGRSSVRLTTDYLREQFAFAPARDHTVLLGGSLRRLVADVDLDANDPRCTEFDPNCDLSSAARVRTQQRLEANFADAYVTDRWQFLPNWSADFGLRWSQDGYLKRSHLEPRLGLAWQATPSTLVSAAWGRHNEFPDGSQVARDIGNPMLRHLESTQSVIGVNQRLGTDWSWKLEAYHKRFENLVVADPTVNYVNGGSGESRGVELLIKREPRARLSGFLALSVAEAKRRNDLTGERFPFDYDQPVVATWVTSYKASAEWQVGFRWTFHSGSPITPVVGTGTYPDGRVRPIYGAINSERLPNYHRLDLRADRTITPNLSLYVELINAYGRKNVAGYTYDANWANREPVYQLPFLPTVGLKYRF
ncbi:MAG: TonB-dependent receptor plug domain-containing protein [Burkholderiaceae bacterium]